MGSDYKPVLENMPKHVQDAVGALLGEIAKGVAANPVLSQQEKMASLVEGTGAFNGIANKIQLGDNQLVAARPVGDMSQSRESGIV